MSTNMKILLTILLLAIAAIGLADLAFAATPKTYTDVLALFSSPSKLDASIPESARGTLGTHHWMIIIQDGPHVEYYSMTTANGHVVATSRGRRTTPEVTAKMMTSRQTIDAILASPNAGKAVIDAIQRGAIKIEYSSGAAAWRLRAMVGAANAGLLGSAQQVSNGKPAGAVCAHGGECDSSNCVGDGIGGSTSWTYRCSCDPYRYTTTGCKADSSLVPRTKDNGQVCAHGGECQSGNCVGMGQGPPWTYGCSCDPFVFRTTCTR